MAKHKLDSPIKSLRFVDASYHKDGGETLFENLSITFNMGHVTWIKGNTGSGRSTIAQMIAGITLPTSGKYFIDEVEYTDLTFDESVPFRLSFGFSFDLGGLISNQTLFQNLNLPLMYHNILPPAEAQARINEYLAYFSIENSKDQRPAMVSGGVRKVTCLIRALILEPRVLVLDEPSQGLSFDNQQILVWLIDQQKSKGTLQHVFITSQDDRFMKGFQDKEVIVIKDKNLICQVPVKEGEI